MAKKTEHASPRDFFLHLLSTLALYLSAVGLLTLLFQFVNYFFPDPVTDPFYQLDSMRGAVRWGIALIVIVFPIYAWTIYFLGRVYKKDPSARNVRVRKWLNYFTLFVASVVIIGDLISLLLRFLEGELTVRFSLKIVAILFVAGSIFWYYLKTIHHEKKSMALRIFSYAVIAVAAASVVGAFFLIGTPQDERLRRLDSQRVDVLHESARVIEQYYAENEMLPENYDTVRNMLTPYTRDLLEKNNIEIEYTPADTYEYTLCTTFDKASSEVQRYPRLEPIYQEQVPYDWSHDAGRVCFDRTIPRAVRENSESAALFPPIAER